MKKIQTLLVAALVVASVQTVRAEMFTPGTVIGGLAGFCIGGPVGAGGGAWLGRKIEGTDARLANVEAGVANHEGRLTRTEGDVNHIGNYVVSEPWRTATMPASNDQVVFNDDQAKSDWRKLMPKGNGGIYNR